MEIAASRAPDGVKKELNALTYDVDIDLERVKPW